MGTTFVAITMGVVGNGTTNGVGVGAVGIGVLGVTNGVTRMGAVGSATGCGVGFVGRSVGGAAMEIGVVGAMGIKVGPVDLGVKTGGGWMAIGVAIGKLAMSRAAGAACGLLLLGGGSKELVLGVVFNLLDAVAVRVGLFFSDRSVSPLLEVGGRMPTDIADIAGMAEATTVGGELFAPTKFTCRGANDVCCAPVPMLPLPINNLW